MKAGIQKMEGGNEGWCGCLIEGDVDEGGQLTPRKLGRDGIKRWEVAVIEFDPDTRFALEGDAPSVVPEMGLAKRRVFERVVANRGHGGSEGRIADFGEVDVEIIEVAEVGARPGLSGQGGTFDEKGLFEMVVEGVENGFGFGGACGVMTGLAEKAPPPGCRCFGVEMEREIKAGFEESSEPVTAGFGKQSGREGSGDVRRWGGGKMVHLPKGMAQEGEEQPHG